MMKSSFSGCVLSIMDEFQSGATGIIPGLSGVCLDIEFRVQRDFLLSLGKCCSGNSFSRVKIENMSICEKKG